MPSLLALIALTVIAAAPSDELQILQATLDAHFSESGGRGRPLHNDQALLCRATRFTPSPSIDAGIHDADARAAARLLASANRNDLDLEPLAAPRAVVEVDPAQCGSWATAFPSRSGLVEISRPAISGSTAVVRLMVRERERTTAYTYIVKKQEGDRWTVAFTTAGLE